MEKPTIVIVMEFRDGYLWAKRKRASLNRYLDSRLNDDGSEMWTKQADFVHTVKAQNLELFKSMVTGFLSRYEVVFTER